MGNVQCGRSWQSDASEIIDSTYSAPASCTDEATCTEYERLLLATCTWDMTSGCQCAIHRTPSAMVSGTYTVVGNEVTRIGVFFNGTTTDTGGFCVSGETLQMKYTLPVSTPAYALSKRGQW